MYIYIRELVVIDTEKEKKGQSMMDALLSKFRFTQTPEVNKGKCTLKI